jgi:glutaredoxin
MPSRPRVVLYARPECHLCDQARAGLERLRADGLEFDLDEVDIETDEQLHARFLERIPVVVLEGETISELHLDADALTARLRS